MSLEDSYYRDSLVEMREFLLSESGKAHESHFESRLLYHQYATMISVRLSTLQQVIGLIDVVLEKDSETDEERNARRSTPEGQKN